MTRCQWCRRPPQDYPTCDTSPCGLLVAELDIATEIALELSDDPRSPVSLEEAPEETQ